MVLPEGCTNLYSRSAFPHIFSVSVEILQARDAEMRFIHRFIEGNICRKIKGAGAGVGMERPETLVKGEREGRRLE